jgi:hypothetical protein
LHAVVGEVHTAVIPVAHWTQFPDDPHTGVVPVQSAGVDGLHARHTRGAVKSQIDCPDGQLAFEVQTQALLVQVPVVQLVPTRHCTQRPVLVPVVAQNPVGALQSALAEHGRQVCEVASQMGVGPAQSALVAHASWQEWNAKRHTPACAGTTFDVVARFSTPAVREPGNCE